MGRSRRAPSDAGHGADRAEPRVASAGEPGRRAPLGGLASYSALRQAADACQTLTLNWYLASGPGAAGLLGLAWVAVRLPWLVLPLSGAAADRVSRRRLIVGGDLAVAALGLAAAAAVAWRGRAAALAFLLLYGLGYAAVRPATKGLSRELAPSPRAAARLSGLLTAIEYAALLVAQLAAGRWLLPRGPAWGLGTMVVLLALGCAVLAAGVPAGAAASGPEPPMGGRQVVRLLWSPPLRGPFAMTVACGACAFALLPLAPLLAMGHGHLGSLHYAVSMAAYSLGAAGGAALVRATEGWRLGVRGAALAWLAAAPAVALAPRLGPAGTALCFAVVGAAAGFQDAGNAARVAALIPPGAQSQAMALGSLVWRLPGVLAGLIVAGAARVPPATLCAVLAGVLAVLAAGGVWMEAGGGRGRRTRQWVGIANSRVSEAPAGRSGPGPT